MIDYRTYTPDEMVVLNRLEEVKELLGKLCQEATNTDLAEDTMDSFSWLEEEINNLIEGTEDE